MQKTTVSANSIKTPNSTQISTSSPTIRRSDSQPVEIVLDHIAPDRRRLWVEILKEAHSFLGREDLAGNRLKMAIKTFDRLCQGIPTGVLRDVFDLSLGLTDYNGAPIFWDGRALLIAWEQNAGALREKLSKALLSTTPRVNCPDCLGNSTGRKYIKDEKARSMVLSSEFCRHENDRNEYDQLFGEVE